MPSNSELSRLFHSDLNERRIECGKRRLLEHRAQIEALLPTDDDATMLLFASARWLEYIPDMSSVLDRLLERFSQSQADWPSIDMANAYSALHKADPRRAMRACMSVISNSHRVIDPLVVGTAHYTIARVLKDMAKYRGALKHAEAAAGYLSPHAGLLAVVHITLGWLHQQLGDYKLAVDYFRRAYPVIMATEDWTNQGSLLFHRARSCSRTGDYTSARKIFLQSIEHYRLCVPPHRNICRSYVGLAKMERLMALSTNDLGVRHRLRGSAAENLKTAESLLKDYYPDDHRNRGRVALTCGWLLLDEKRVKSAELRAEDAQQIAHQAGDSLLSARSSHLKAAIELDRIDRALVDNIERSGRIAMNHCSAALKLALQTDAKRLVARCYSLLGKIALRNPYRDVHLAEECWDDAVRIMEALEDTDYVPKEVQSLRTQIEQFKTNCAVRSHDDDVLYIVRRSAASRPWRDTMREIRIVVTQAAWDEHKTERGVRNALDIGHKAAVNFRECSESDVD